MEWIKWYSNITRLESGRTWLVERVAGVWFLGCWKWWTNLHTQTIIKGVWYNNCRYSIILCCDASQTGLISMLSAGRGCIIMVTDILYQGLTYWVPRMLTDAHKGKKKYQNHFLATIQDGRWGSLVTSGHGGWDVGLYFWTKVQELVNGIALQKVFKKVEIKRMLSM